MVAVVIFWSATFAIIFFVLGIVFKALASAFNALLVSMGRIFVVGGLALLTGIALYLLYAVIESGIKEGFWSAVVQTIISLAALGITGVIIGKIGGILLEFVVIVAAYIFEIVSAILEWLAITCEKGYAKFLTVIIKQLNRC